ncbi:uncharacterized protein BO88DRAFT_451255 [Aspergillus vadensis CBS 113365]|uniref:Uncharacterized protein n=1 Tax=Aspergillus vadensis (strain CBS 113365 / IMI 142717 / IBT 24658) TaxID=1448311 RepID=A0A319CTJ5_ASPVC|nr:hypothetical protein BO88DRAFT_451255 [Aspergillus vadensis CBS 113365]PYH71572.1 hypothetical protein BO88DRAFT_451255 [Aspergillus vadensis CBS 113365]
MSRGAILSYQWPFVQACWPINGASRSVMSRLPARIGLTRGFMSFYMIEGDISPNRIPRGPTVWLEEKGICWYPMLRGSYVLGGEVEWSDIDILNTMLDLFIENQHTIVVDATFTPAALKGKIKFVPNRKGHDFRAAKTAPGVGTGANAAGIMFL